MGRRASTCRARGGRRTRYARRCRVPTVGCVRLAVYSTQCYDESVKRVLKTKAFARWCTLSDQVLRSVAEEIERGEFEADLGKGVVKKRVAYPGGGKSGGARLLVAKRMKGFIVFLVGRDKSDPGTDFTPAQEAAAKELAVAYEKLSTEQVKIVIDSGALKEIGSNE